MKKLKFKIKIQKLEIGKFKIGSLNLNSKIACIENGNWY